MSHPPLMSRLAPCVALLVLVLNDHLLKGAGLLPGPLTGKLSDLAGLFFFPILLGALVRAIPPSLACALTGACFTALKLDPGVNAFAARWWGPAVMDPTDLVALVMLVPAWWFMRRPALGAPRRALEYGAIVVASAASVATSAPPMAMFDQPRQFPSWQIAGSQDALIGGCVHAHLWVVRSIKAGIGIGVRVENRCDAAVELSAGGELVVGEDERLSRAERIALGAQRWTLEPGQLERRYIPIAFDNELAWDEGRRVAILALRWRLSAAPKQAHPVAQALVPQNVLLRHLRVADHRVRQLHPEASP
jgi:hypothetical protein